MDRKELKKRWLMGTIQPELFYLPWKSKDKIYDPPLIYKVKQNNVYLCIGCGYHSYYKTGEDYIVDGVNLGQRNVKYDTAFSTAEGRIEWSDSDDSYDEFSISYDEQTAAGVFSLNHNGNTITITRSQTKTENSIPIGSDGRTFLSVETKGLSVEYNWSSYANNDGKAEYISSINVYQLHHIDSQDTKEYILKNVAYWGDAGSPTKIYHNYTTSSEIYKTIRVYGNIPEVHIGGFPVEIVQWGNIHLKYICGFIEPNNVCADCATEFTVPDAPITGMDEVEEIHQMFNDCAIAKIPDNFFANCKNLIVAHSLFYECKELTHIGNNLFKNLKSLCLCEYIGYNCPKLEYVGDGLFENCVNLDAYIVQNYSYRPWYTGNLHPFNNCPIYCIGNNMYKNCTGLQLLVSSHYLDEFYDNGGRFDSSFGLFGYNLNNSSYKLLQIGESAFEGCTGLKFLNYWFYMTKLVALPCSTFKGCTSVVSTSAIFHHSCCLALENGIFDDMKNLRYIADMYDRTLVSCLPDILSKKKNIFQALYCVNTSVGVTTIPSYSLREYLSSSYSEIIDRIDDDNYTRVNYYTYYQNEIVLLDGTKLPELEQDELYICKVPLEIKINGNVCTYNCKLDEVTNENWRDYIYIWKWRILDVTNMFSGGFYDNIYAQMCFYNGFSNNIQTWDYNSDHSDIVAYSYSPMVGTIPDIWNYACDNLNSAVYNMPGISNLNDIPQDERRIIGYAPYGGKSNIEITKEVGRVRPLSDYSIKKFKKMSVYVDGKLSSETIIEI